jgi:putative heme-binding domain-containing protein
MLQRARAEGPAYALTAEAVESFAALDDAAARSFLRERWQEPSLRGAIVRALARRPEEADRGRFVEALALADEEAVAAALNALHALPAPSPADPDALRAALEALDRFSAFKERAAARYLIVRLLIRWTGVDVPVVEGPDLRASYKPYFDWFRRAYPEAAAELALGGGDWESWRERLAKVDWERGDASRGRAVFAARSCESCHGSSSRLGPDLRGAAGRFSREDLFRAIVEPSRDVSPAFASKLVLTRSGRAYRGVLIYDSPAVTLLQVSADVAARFGPGEIVETRDTEDSFMPAGLADGLKDGELADLYAYLKTLR